ncbi:MAG: hypothetical protein IJ544_07350 [Prevotella sp.]|nr:hypothetical protein [Prevotella sp.]
MKSTVKAMLMLLAVMLIAGCAQKSKLKDIVEQENAGCPYLLEDGVTVTKVELANGNTVAFFISLDDTYGEFLDEEEGRDLLKGGMLHWFTDGDSPFKEAVEAVINEGGTIGCAFQNEGGTKWKCEFESYELEEARNENAGIFDDDDEEEIADSIAYEDYDDTEAVDFESLANNSDDLDLDNMSDGMKETVLKLGIEEANKTMPQDLGDGLTMKSVKLAGSNLVYTVGVDEDQMDIAMLEMARDVMKEAMIGMVKEGDQDMQFICRLLVETNRGMDFKYVGNTSGKSVNIHLTSSELKRAIGL